jgi:hypothetical protein
VLAPSRPPAPGYDSFLVRVREDETIQSRMN